MTTDAPWVRQAKHLFPQPVKDGVEQVIRWGAGATSPWRPPPDFLVLGAKRGGSTTLWQLLQRHPQVAPMVPAAKHLKSSNYFFEHYDKGWSWYAGHFPSRWARSRGPYGRLVAGEASPMYLFDPRVPGRVARDLPDAKLLVVLRDPVDRAYSHWRERRKEGVEALAFSDALEAEAGRLAGEWERTTSDPSYYSRALDWFSYRTRGLYAEQLERWFDHVPRERVLVLRSEDLYNEQSATMVTVERFLGLDHHPVADIWTNRLGGTLTEAVRDHLEQFYDKPNQRLAALLGDSLWWPGPTRH